MIVALVVFAFAFAVLMEVAGSGLRAARRSSDYTQAALHAQTVLDSMGVGEPLETGTDSGRFDDRFDWQIDVREEEAPPSWSGLTEPVPVDLYRVDLTVHWKDGEVDRDAKFATLRARQPGLDAGAGQ
jgi:general secretion pathway protein I